MGSHAMKDTYGSKVIDELRTSANDFIIPSSDNLILNHMLNILFQFSNICVQLDTASL